MFQKYLQPHLAAISWEYFFVWCHSLLHHCEGNWNNAAVDWGLQPWANVNWTVLRSVYSRDFSIISSHFLLHLLVCGIVVQQRDLVSAKLDRWVDEGVHGQVRIARRWPYGERPRMSSPGKTGGCVEGASLRSSLMSFLLCTVLTHARMHLTSKLPKSLLL